MVGQISRLTILLISWWLTTPVVSAVSSVVHVVFGSSTVMVVVVAVQIGLLVCSSAALYCVGFSQLFAIGYSSWVVLVMMRL